MQRRSPSVPPRTWVGVAAGIWLLHLLGACFPRGFTWGFHFLAYLPPALAGLLLAGTAALIVTAPRNRELDRWCARAEAWGNRRDALAGYVGLGLLVLLLGWFGRERVHAFGDGLNIVKWFGENRSFNPEWLRALWTANLSENRETLTVALHRLLAFWSGAPIASVYTTVSLLSGVLATLVWLWHCRSDAALRPWLAPLLLAGLGLGGNAIYLGHVENYALPVALAMLLLAIVARSPGGGRSVTGVCLLFVLIIRMHIAYLLLLPVVFVFVVEALARRWPRLAALTAPRALGLLWVLLPIVGGTLLYFQLFHAAVWHSGPPEPLFLPLSGMQPPLRPYTIFAPAHLLDFPNGLVQALLPAMAILLPLAGWRRLARLGPRGLALAASVLLLVVFLFAANMGFSPARDWDLYALTMPPFLFLLAALVCTLSESQAPGAPGSPRAGALLVGLVAAPFALAGEIVDGAPASLTPRLADLAVHVYQSYYIGTGQILNLAAQIGPDRPVTARLVRAAVDRMRPPERGPDPEYSRAQFVLCQTEFEAGRADQAAACLERSIAAYPGDINTLMRAAAFYEVLKRPAEARIYLRRLIEMDPGNVTVWKSYVRAECGRGDYGPCMEALRGALARFPAEADFLELDRLLKSQTPPPPGGGGPPVGR